MAALVLAPGAPILRPSGRIAILEIGLDRPERGVQPHRRGSLAGQQTTSGWRHVRARSRPEWPLPPTNATAFEMRTGLCRQSLAHETWCQKSQRAFPLSSISSWRSFFAKEIDLSLITRGIAPNELRW